MNIKWCNNLQIIASKKYSDTSAAWKANSRVDTDSVNAMAQNILIDEIIVQRYHHATKVETHLSLRFIFD